MKTKLPVINNQTNQLFKIFILPNTTLDNQLGTVDKRTTIYYNAHLATNTTGTNKFNFYNTNEAGIYRIVIEGIGLMVVWPEEYILTT